MSAESIVVEFRQNAEEFLLAMDIRDRKSGYVTRKKIQTGAAVILMAMFLYDIIQTPTYIQGYVLFLLAAGLLAFIWLLPAMTNKKYVSERVAENEVCRAEFSENGLVYTEGTAVYQIGYEDSLFVYECGENLVVVFNKTKTFTIPNTVDAQQREQISSLLKQHLGNRYEQIVLKK